MIQDTRNAGLADLPSIFTGEALVFMLGNVRCALPLSVVVEVVRAVRISPLPTAPSIVEGVIDVRGTILPVLDLRARLGLPSTPVRPAQFLVLARADDRPVAVRADAVEWLVPLQRDQLVGAEQITRGIGYLSGVARTPAGLVLVHDLSRFLRQGEAEALDSALARRGESGVQ